MAEDNGNNKGLNEASRAADKRLRQAHQDEWNGYKSEEATARGLAWKPRLSEKEKAAKQLADILAAHPDLAQQV